MWAGTVVVGLIWVGVQTGAAAVREEFDQTYPLAVNGQVRLDNVNGRVHVTAWDRADIQVHALKRADSQQDLQAIKIEIDSKPDSIRIHTKFPDRKGIWRKGTSGSVDYELKVPVQATLADVKTVNGSMEVEGVRGPVRASTVNGRVAVKGLAADSRLETVNGAVDADFESLEGVKSVSVKTVNGGVDLLLPVNAHADVSAKTVNGGLHSMAGLTVKKHWPIGSSLSGKLGNGGARVSAETVNGGIRFHQAAAASGSAERNE